MPNPIFRFVCAVSKPFLFFLDWITPFIALVARCWISYAFLKSGILKIQTWDSTLALFMYEFHIPLLSAEVAAVIGTACEIALPILIILGLGGRLVVAALFIFNIVAAASYPYLWTPDGLNGLIQHINWGVMLMLLMCFGTGTWTLDRLFMRMCKGNKDNTA
ncbi:MAG: DoxX family protein [Coxiellaceae bacterium]|nr:DoxX family protein [Coxiellaceae bacterium]